MVEKTRRPEFPRTISTLLLLLGAAVLGVTLLFTTMDPWLDKGGILVGGLDVHIYRDGGWRVLHDRALYVEPTHYGLLYTYTPFSALAFLPLNLIPWAHVTTTWMVLNLLVLFTCVLQSWRMLGYRVTPRLAVVSALITLACTFAEPVRTTLYYGQINLWLMLLVLWDFSRGEHSRLRGVGVGIAAGIKLTPLYFVAQYLAQRRWRAACTAALTFLGSIALTSLILPGDSYQYWTSTFFQSGRIAPDTHPANQSLRGAIAHLIDRPAPIWLWLLIAVPITLVALWLAAVLVRRGEPLLSVTLGGLTACAVSPYSWGHHWVWFVPLLVYLIHRAQTRRTWWFAAAGLYLAIAAWTYGYSPTWVSVGTFLLPPSWPGSPVFMNVYVVLYLIVLGGIVKLVRAPRADPAPIEPIVIAPPEPDPLRVARLPRVADGTRPDDDRPAMVD
ncbi:Polyprenol-phosphate-mannose-dependent alpha-(1-2)-phosphatidylinositol pentamannoside mannosyltransferase [Nocardia asteroides]|nr:alpha-1,2-mannosyltransferase [Nocardia asteroides]VEG33668.1 Polyprenol-phosphate-mannose-dependent alpha-(1-2)-phosphatidylinositol pentamannoside mannosyltransferase [Nocardia asteroides]